MEEGEGREGGREDKRETSREKRRREKGGGRMEGLKGKKEKVMKNKRKKGKYRQILVYELIAYFYYPSRIAFFLIPEPFSVVVLHSLTST